MAVPDPTDTEILRWPLSGREPDGYVTVPVGPKVAWYDFGGSGPPLLLVHATGFCAAVLAPLAARLAGQFRCIAFDQRAHGHSEPPPDSDFAWSGFADDVIAVVESLELRGAFAFGHSCGAAALLLAEEAKPGRFAGLYCYEPIIYPSDEPLAASLDNNPLSAGALRRRSQFADRHEALANFSAKAPFDRLEDDVLAAYVDNGFEDDPDGGIRLRCRREDEAQVYANGFSHDAFAKLSGVACPVTLACGEETDAIGPDFLGRYAARLADVEQVVLGAVGHFGPLEDPTLVASSVTGSMALRPGTSASA